MIRVAINGFGRIGRYVGKLVLDRDNLELVAVNDLASAEQLAYLLRYDSVYGRYGKSVEVRDGSLIIDGRTVQVLSEKAPAQLPWGDLGIDVAIESTGFFERTEEAEQHLEAGAKFVILAAPNKGEKSSPTILLGVNDDDRAGHNLVNQASCTTNNIAPVIAVLDEAFGVERALMTTTHAYTSTQSLMDAPCKDPRRGRMAAENIVPTSTGAAIATTEAIPSLKDRFDGIALRVPLKTGSISDITAVLKRETTVEEVNGALEQAAKTDRFKGILAVTAEPIVSSDIIGDPHSAIVDLDLTRAIGNLVKVFAWYDNEAGYSHRVVEMVEQLATAQNR